MKTCIIIAGGDFDISTVSAEKLKSEAELIICADRGLKYAEKMGLKPDILIGDFDSYLDEVSFDGEIIRTVPEKDDTDTIMAVRLAISRGVRRIVLYGALGGRFDHSIANIQTLLFASEQGCEMTIADRSDIISLQDEGTAEYPCKEGYYFSVFALSESVFIEELSGVKYPLENYLMKQSFPIGVSNEITSEKAVLKIKTGTALIVRSKM